MQGLAFLSETMRQEQRPEICALVPLRLLPETFVCNKVLVRVVVPDLCTQNP